MALITCPECGKQISDKAEACPNCGYPLADLHNVKEVSQGDMEASENSADDATMNCNSTNENTPVKSKFSKLTAIVSGIAILIVLLVFILPTKITAQNVKITQLYNTSLGFGLKLGMSKDSIDKVLGDPEMSYGDYLYPDQYLYAQYNNGKLISMYIEYPNDRWVTSGGVTAGADLDSVKETFGEPDGIEHNDEWWYYATGNIVTGVKVFKSSEKVDAIYIYDSNWESKLKS